MSKIPEGSLHNPEEQSNTDYKHFVEESDFEVIANNSTSDNENTVTLTSGNKGYKVDFSDLKKITVVQYSLLDSDSPGTFKDQATSKYWAFSSEKTVGDYDDWQIKIEVQKAAKAKGIQIPEEVWYKE